MKGKCPIFIRLGTVLVCAGLLIGCQGGNIQGIEAEATTSEVYLPSVSNLPETTPMEVYLPSVSNLSAADVLCEDIQPPWVTGFDVLQPPELAEPAARLPFRDLIFGSCLMRITDRLTDLEEGDSGGMKNEYSRVQAFNADESRLLVMTTQGNWYLYDAATFQPLGRIPLGMEPRWDASDPQVIYYNEYTQLMSYNVETGAASLVHDFSADFPQYNLTAVWTRYEGSPTADSRYWGLMAENQDWLTIVLFVYDRLEDRIISRLDLPEPYEIDNVSISPLGNYFLAFYDNYCDYGELGTFEQPCGLMVYNQSLSEGRGMLRIVGHSDLALDAQGREVFVFQSIDTDHIAMLDLETGVVTPLVPIDFSYTPIGLHFSGQAFNRPGWAVVSTHDGDTQSHTWMDDSVFLIELRAGGRVVRLAHTHSLVDETQEHDYWAEPQVTTNRNLTRLLFTTNWNRSGTEEVEMFLIMLPDNWDE